MSLFSNLYNKITGFFKTQESPGDASKSVATNRLKLVLMQDRTNLTPRILEQMRSELIELLSRYVELDKELLDLNFEQEGDQVALMLSIPVIRAKDEEEIDAAIKAREELLKAASKTAEETENTEETEETEENSGDDTTIQDVESSENAELDDNRTEEEKEEANKAEAIAQELQSVPKIIKKKKVSNPENMNNPFKSDATETLEKVETSTEV